MPGSALMRSTPSAGAAAATAEEREMVAVEDVCQNLSWRRGFGVRPRASAACRVLGQMSVSELRFPSGP
jgi:hypothetical protein